MDMPVTDDVKQPVGFLHGGATITLLESCCSLASWLGCDLENEYSFGSHIDVKHVNAVRSGMLHGVATLESSEDLGEKGRKEFWHVEATDDDGRLVSTGTITCRVVSKAYFAQKS
jgi:1,4-dihydroxy-2-naphthoyl-CoA hydrolase